MHLYVFKQPIKATKLTYLRVLYFKDLLSNSLKSGSYLALYILCAHIHISIIFLKIMSIKRLEPTHNDEI
jgi:hypothetical protein